MRFSFYFGFGFSSTRLKASIDNAAQSLWHMCHAGQHVLHDLAADKWFMPRFGNFLKLSELYWGYVRGKRERKKRNRDREFDKLSSKCEL